MKNLIPILFLAVDLEKISNIVDEEKILNIVDIEVNIWGGITVVFVFAAVVSGVSHIAGPDFWAILAGISWLFFMIFLSIQKMIERLTETKTTIQPERSLTEQDRQSDEPKSISLY